MNDLNATPAILSAMMAPAVLIFACGLIIAISQRLNLAMSGTALFLYSSLLLIFESRIALMGVNNEIDFVIRSSRYEVPANLLKLLIQPREHRKRLFRLMKF